MLKRRVTRTQRTLPLDAVLKVLKGTIILWRVDMNFWSQFFPEKSARKDGLDLFLAFRDHFQEGDIHDLEQRCPDAVDHFCLPLSLL